MAEFFGSTWFDYGMGWLVFLVVVGIALLAVATGIVWTIRGLIVLGQHVAKGYREEVQRQQEAETAASNN